MESSRTPSDLLRRDTLADGGSSGAAAPWPTAADTGAAASPETAPYEGVLKPGEERRKGGGAIMGTLGGGR